VIHLYSYPALFGVADNNPYGLKVFAFLKLSRLAFAHEHIFDASSAPHGQLPYIRDDDDVVGDSDTIIGHLTRKYGLALDERLANSQRTTGHLIRRTLDDLYWVMSYSRWRDPQFWPLFRDEMLNTHSSLSEDGMESARKYNFERYRYQGIGRYEPAEVYARGIADLQAVADAMPASGFLFGDEPTSVDAGVYGFVANILYFRIETPLKRLVASHAKLVSHCDAIHSRIAA
jgi:glutathione S-transferase